MDDSIPVVFLLLFGVIIGVAQSQDVSSRTMLVCRDDQTNLTYNVPNAAPYSFIDLHYTRRSEPGKAPYEGNVIMGKIGADDWKVFTNPTRFIGRLNSPDRPTSSQILTIHLADTRRIDNGRYLLTAVPERNSGAKKIDDAIDLIVFHDDNYFPRLWDTNDTDSDTDTYAYTWVKPEDSPSIGVSMMPRSEGEALDKKEKSTDFAGDLSCEINFEPSDLVHGRVTFDAEYLFPDNFRQCHELLKPATNIIIDIPRTVTTGFITGLAVGALVLVVGVSVMTYLIIRKTQTSKWSLTWKERKTFVAKCIDHLQDCSNIVELKGIYRLSTPKSSLNGYITAYKEELNRGKSSRGKATYTVEENENDYRFENAPKVVLASGIKYVLQMEELWIPEDTQKYISEKDAAFVENGEFETDKVRQLFTKDGTRKDILATIFRHFDWYLTKTRTIPDKIAAGLLDKDGLATCVAPNFFNKVPAIDQDSASVHTQRWISFVKHIMDNHEAVFPIVDPDETIHKGDSSTSPFLRERP